LADNTKIEWTDATWNPITGCAVVSPGCTNCYAMKLAGTRLKHHESRKGLTKDTKAGPVWTGELRFNCQWLDEPFRWKRPRMIFVCAHGDLFAEGVPNEWIDQVFAVMSQTPQHTFQVLTKRPERMREYLTTPRLQHRLVNTLMSFEFPIPTPGRWPHMPLPNVWLGVSVEDQKRADERIPILIDTPGAIRWISAEPLLGPLDLMHLPAKKISPNITIAGNAVTGIDGLGKVGPKLDWIVAGGESGPGARPMHPDWARSLRDQCAEAQVPFLFKQWGAWTPGENVERQRGVVETAELINDTWHYAPENLANSDGHYDDEPDVYRVGKKAAGRLLDGIEHNGFPEVRR
jgi:protein gp37